jgi:hypothetical protein
MTKRNKSLKITYISSDLTDKEKEEKVSKAYTIIFEAVLERRKIKENERK